jgi:hypothetical protein
MIIKNNIFCNTINIGIIIFSLSYSPCTFLLFPLLNHINPDIKYLISNSNVILHVFKNRILD